MAQACKSLKSFHKDKPFISYDNGVDTISKYHKTLDSYKNDNLKIKW
jgi:hypothetical protein